MTACTLASMVWSQHPLTRWGIIAMVTSWTLSASLFAQGVASVAFAAAALCALVTFACTATYCIKDLEHQGRRDDASACGLAFLMAGCTFTMCYPIALKTVALVAIGCGCLFVIALGQVVEEVARVTCRSLWPSAPHPRPAIKVVVFVLGVTLAITSAVLVQDWQSFDRLGTGFHTFWRDIDVGPVVSFGERCSTWVRSEAAQTWQSVALFTSLWGLLIGGGQVAEHIERLMD